MQLMSFQVHKAQCVTLVSVFLLLKSKMPYGLVKTANKQNPDSVQLEDDDDDVRQKRYDYQQCPRNTYMHKDRRLMEFGVIL